MARDDDDYMFNRVHQDSARLVVQHWLWTHRLRYVLHPTIPTKADYLKVADIGTGNAVWLMELLPLMPSTTQFDGFDISADYYPAQDWLPSNVSLDILDAFGEIPEHLVGKYDIVHLRAFVVIVRNNDPTKLLSNLLKMLKPGGYLQWDEMDFNTFLPAVVNPTASKAAADEFMAQWRSKCVNSGILFDWIPNLETTFRRNGLSNVTATTFSPINEQRKVFTDNALMGVENMLRAFSARKKDTTETDNKLQWQDSFQKAVMESKKGMSITSDLIVVTGQKPG